MPLDPNIPLQVKPIEIQSPVQSIGALMNMRGLASEVQLRQAQVQEAQQRSQLIQAEADQHNRDLGDQNTIQDLMKDPETAKAISSGDMSGLSGKVQLSTIDKVRESALKAHQTLAATHAADLKLWTDQHGELEKAGSGLLALPDDASVQSQFPGTWAELTKAGIIAPGTPMPTVTGKDDVKKMLAQNAALQGALMGASKLRGEQLDQQMKEAELPGKEADVKIKQADATIKQFEASMLDASITGNFGAQIDKGIADPAINKTTHAMVDASPTLAGKQAALKAGFEKQMEIQKAESEIPGAVKKAVAISVAEEPSKMRVARAGAIARSEGQIQASGATEDDFSRAGQQYAITGVMPPLGNGAAGRLKVEHYAQQYARDSGLTPRDLAVAQAAFKGDTKSLENFQKQRDQIVSFEQTAQKNLDLFLNAAAKIHDTGSPWLNTPLRALDQSAVGSANMAAVNAARQVANNEIAKVTSGGGLSGVLSDAARHEVMSYNPANATFKQTVAVAKVLKQDMANRHASMDQSLAEIKGRIANPGAVPAPAASAGGMIRARDPQGKLHEAPAGTALPPGWRLE